MNKLIGKLIVKGMSEGTALKIQVGATLAGIGLGLWFQKKDSDRYHRKCDAVEDRFDELCTKLEKGDGVELGELMKSADVQSIQIG